MEHSFADSWKPVVTVSGSSVRRFADKIRFVAGTAIACGGAAVWLSDLLGLAGAVG